MNTRDIKTKKPWRRVLPIGYLGHGTFVGANIPNAPDDKITSRIVTQEDFLREYYPSGHAINDPKVYPDIYREEIVPIYNNDGVQTDTQRKVYKEEVPRYAFAFQRVITTKQIVHLCGNDIQFEINKEKPSSEEEKSFNAFREGWMDKDMEVRFYELAKSVKITGDGAVVGYINNGEFGTMSLSFLNGDKLYPHYDSITGKLLYFARAYNDYDEDGEIMVEWLEVWDDTNLYRYRRTGEAYKNTIDKILSFFNMEGYKKVYEKPHGFKSVPVAYHRDEDGACWSASQDSIDGYEMSFSQMAHNNQAYGEPILVLQGENVEASHDVSGSIKMLTMGSEDKASYLSSQSASESYMRQLDTLYKMIYEQSFTVIPPELKAGDLPAAALKILYSPAYEKAVNDAAEYQQVLNDLVDIFAFGYGMEAKMQRQFLALPMKWWIKPYVHQNLSAIVSDLAIAVQNGFCSKQTASERILEYTTVGEWERVMKEAKEQQEADMLFEIRSKQQPQKDDNIIKE